MANVRPNIVKDASARQKYAKGVNLLKREFTGPTTASLGISGPSRPVSTYDLFVVWHHTAMTTMTPTTQGDRNAAHRGPVFCPWHRFMLRQLELNLQRVLNDMISDSLIGIGPRMDKKPRASKKNPPYGHRMRWADQEPPSKRGHSS